MQLWVKLLVSSIAALALGAGVASASKFSINEPRVRVTWTPLTRLSFSSAVAEVACAVTLEGSFHSSTISKTARALIGYISRASIATAECIANGNGVSSGSAVLLPATLPWHIQYDSFTGILPTPSGARIRLVDASFRARITIFISTIECLYRSTAANPLVGRAELNAGGTILKLRADEAFEIPYVEGPGTCPASIAPRGEGTVRRLGTTTQLVTLTLI